MKSHEASWSPSKSNEVHWSLMKFFEVYRKFKVSESLEVRCFRLGNIFFHHQIVGLWEVFRRNVRKKLLLIFPILKGFKWVTTCVHRFCINLNCLIMSNLTVVIDHWRSTPYPVNVFPLFMNTKTLLFFSYKYE